MTGKFGFATNIMRFMRINAKIYDFFVSSFWREQFFHIQTHFILQYPILMQKNQLRTLCGRSFTDWHTQLDKFDWRSTVSPLKCNTKCLIWKSLDLSLLKQKNQMQRNSQNCKWNCKKRTQRIFQHLKCRWIVIKKTNKK